MNSKITQAEIEFYSSDKPKSSWGGSRGGGRKPLTSTPVDRSKALYLEPWMWEAASGKGEPRAVIRAILERELKK